MIALPTRPTMQLATPRRAIALCGIGYGACLEIQLHTNASPGHSIQRALRVCTAETIHTWTHQDQPLRCSLACVEARL